MLDIKADWEGNLENKTDITVKEIRNTRREAAKIVNLFWQKVENSHYNPDLVIFHGPFYDGLPDEYSSIEITLVFSDPEFKWFRDSDELYEFALEAEGDYTIMPRILKVYDDKPNPDVIMLLEKGAIVLQSEKGKTWTMPVNAK